MIIRSRAPLRISFAGGGTDVDPYPQMKGGAVISTSIDRYAYVTIKESQNSIFLKSQDYELSESFDDFSKLVYDGKLDLVKAAIKHFNKQDKFFQCFTHVDAPPGSGLGSSSAVAVSLIGSLAHFFNKKFSDYEVAEKAYDVERIELGIKGGRQDQYASAFGGFNFIEFKSNSVTVTPLNIEKEIINELLASILICNTNITRLSANILQRQSASYEKNDESVLDNLAHIKNSAYEMRKKLLNGEMEEIGSLLKEGWMHKKKLDSEISNENIDKIYDSALTSGAIGGKLMGAGAGGHFLFLCDPDRREEVSRTLTNLGCKIVKFNFDQDGLQTWQIPFGHEKEI